MMMEYIARTPLRVRWVRQFPPMENREAWDAVPEKEKQELLAFALKQRQEPWPVLTAGMYAAFVRSGSRRACETPYFARRVKLCAAALHMCLTGTEEMLPDVEDGLWLLCEETTWAISAHAELNADHPFPDAEKCVLDLFAAQTGMIVSFVCQLLEEHLHRALYVRAQNEVKRRVLAPFMNGDGEWWMGFVRRDLCNWTPWIVSNVLMAANVWMYRTEAVVERACGMLDRWLLCVPEDGGCDEGAGYWNMAGGAFLDCLMLLEQIADVHLWDNAKVQRMMAYPERVYLGAGWFANFADCDARPFISCERLIFAGWKTGNPALVRMGEEMSGSILRELTDTPHLSRTLMRLFPEAEGMTGTDLAEKDVWLPDLQVRIVEKNGLIAAIKGGHNAESHNHNDVGSFLVASRGQMQLVDAGNMVYTAKTFSDRRYELWNCRSAYHSVPVIGGFEQRNGEDYAARDVQHLPDGMALDMAGAYPAEAGVKCCRRTLRVEDGCVTLRDEITLSAPRTVEWVFMLRNEPMLDPLTDGCYMADMFHLWWPRGKGLVARVEKIDVTDSRMAGSYPGALWRLALTMPATDHYDLTFVMEN